MRDFAEYASNPETWLQGARRHLAVAKVLMDRATALRFSPENLFDEFSGCFYSWHLHAGLAVENAVKAVLISKDPSLVLEGKLDIKKLEKLCGKRGHGLLVPIRRELGELPENECHLLEKLEQYVVW